MITIKIENAIIYRADNNKYVKFKNEDKLYKEIVVKEETDDIIEVAEEDN